MRVLVTTTKPSLHRCRYVFVTSTIKEAWMPENAALNIILEQLQRIASVDIERYERQSMEIALAWHEMTHAMEGMDAALHRFRNAVSV